MCAVLENDARAVPVVGHPVDLQLEHHVGDHRAQQDELLLELLLFPSEPVSLMHPTSVNAPVVSSRVNTATALLRAAAT